METGRDQKSPVRRCFKPRPPLRTGCAGFASGCRSSVRGSNDPETLRSSRSRSGRLSGLLSGCPPIDTRPQARAKLGKAQLSDPFRFRKFFAHGIGAIFNEMCTNKTGETFAPQCSVARERDCVLRESRRAQTAFLRSQFLPAESFAAPVPAFQLSLSGSAFCSEAISAPGSSPRACFAGKRSTFP